MDRQTDKRTNRQTNKQTNKQTNMTDYPIVAEGAYNNLIVVLRYISLARTLLIHYITPVTRG